MPYLVVGLGNPGTQYQFTLHNIGFCALDVLAARWNVTFNKDFQAHVTKHAFGSKSVVLAKPQTYMNLSGNSVRQILSFYKIDPKTELLVVSDDLDLPPGQLRLRLSGSAGGHNGLKSIIEQIGTSEFARLRVGIGREGDAAGHVLKPLNTSQRQQFLELGEKTALAIETILDKGAAQAMNTVNKKETGNGP
jgi:PTH1 family peptidyl-tRNA hydrolase